MPKLKNSSATLVKWEISNETFLVIFKHCDAGEVTDGLRDKWVWTNIFNREAKAKIVRGKFPSD